MDIMELGAIGELVGCVAVVASLVYVGLQVRQSNRQSERGNRTAQSQSNRATARDFNALAVAATDGDPDPDIGFPSSRYAASPTAQPQGRNGMFRLSSGLAKG